MSINVNNTTDTVFSSSGREINSVGSYSSTLDLMQTGTAMLYTSTTNATPKLMAWDASNSVNQPTPTSRFDLATNSNWYVTGQLIASRGDYTDGGSTAQNGCAFDLKFMVGRGASVGTTVIVGTPTITKVFGANNTSVNAASISITADTTNGCPQIAVTGEVGVNWRWVAALNFVRTA